MAMPVVPPGLPPEYRPTDGSVVLRSERMET